MLRKTIPALRPDKDLFILIRAFAASVILLTGNSQFNEANDQPHNRDEEKDGEHAAHVHVHTHVAYSYAHGSLALNNSNSELLRDQVLEMGIVVHSVIIGISLGASESPKTIKPLIAALTFH
ncbi:hypothetical protein FNV43_RR13186 [Rhamnella rubrinervis]|uniref:Uncharacterized protein n=1 Tax=Rhamnella rubrinervis TaxID=2594499 RepID=A0A8K0H0S5_9ROSA|nr:hypothetical protein FNV43_RR13186 [Rhamnella rubrinervis]